MFIHRTEGKYTSMNYISRKKMFIHFLSRAEDILSTFSYLYFIYFSRHNKNLLNHGHKYMWAGPGVQSQTPQQLHFILPNMGAKTSTAP